MPVCIVFIVVNNVLSFEYNVLNKVSYIKVNCFTSSE